MSNAHDFLYTKDHEWLDSTANVVTVGISEHAQNALGDIVFVELPEVGTIVDAGEQIGSIESVKSVSDLYSPVQGEIIEVNKSLEDNPGIVNQDPCDSGWLIKLKASKSDFPGDLMDFDEYTEFTAND